MKGKIKLKAETTSYAYVTFQDAAKYALESARNSETGRFFSCLSAMLYSAFSVEAYLNHLGEHEIADWDVAKYKNPKWKLRTLVEKAGYRPDLATRPFTTFHRIFDFRKLIVHGRTEVSTIQKIRRGALGEQPRLPRTEWEKSITLKNAEIFVEDAESMIRILHPIFGYKSDPFFTEWKSSWQIDPVAEDSQHPTEEINLHNIDEEKQGGG